MPGSPKSRFLKRNFPRNAFTLLELFVAVAIITVLAGLAIPAVQRVRDRAQRSQCANRLKQLGIAAQHYHDTHRVLPPGTMPQVPGEPKPYLSWLARLLPYVEQEALWKETEAAFKANAHPFLDPPHTGLATPVLAFACPSDSRTCCAHRTKGKMVAFTSYLGVEGHDLYSADGMLYLKSRTRFADVTDGTSATLLAGERPPSVDLIYGWWYAGVGQQNTGSCDMHLGVRELNKSRWAREQCEPGPYSYKLGNLNDQCDQFHFWSLHSGGANFLFADGSVHFLNYSADPIMPALATRAGGEAVAVPD